MKRKGDNFIRKKNKQTNKYSKEGALCEQFFPSIPNKFCRDEKNYL